MMVKNVWIVYKMWRATTLEDLKWFEIGDQGEYFFLSKFSVSPDTVCDGFGGSGSEDSVVFWY